MRILCRFLALCCLTFSLLLLPLSGQADLQQGSRGDEVRDLQEKLRDLGLLQDRADGVFGAKTESAVQRLQEYFDLEQTGVVDTETELRLLEIWGIGLGIIEGDGLSEEELRDYYPSFCSWDGMGEYTDGAEFCFRHAEESDLDSLLGGTNPPEALSVLLYSRGCALWYADILNMYDAWEAEADDTEIPESARALFEEEYQAGMAVWREEDPLTALKHEYAYLMEKGVGLCADLHGYQSGNGF